MPAEAPECTFGYPTTQLGRVLDAQAYNRLMLWMRGQTMAICDGRRFNYETGEYEPTGCGPHGPVVYTHDVERWSRAGPIID